MRIKEILEFPFKRLDLYWEDLNTPTGDEKTDKAKEQVKELLPVGSLASAILIVCIISGKALDNAEKGGSAFMFFGGVVIFIMWAFVTLRVRKNHKRHFLHVPTESYPPQHE